MQVKDLEEPFKLVGDLIEKLPIDKKNASSIVARDTALVRLQECVWWAVYTINLEEKKNAAGNKGPKATKNS